MRLSSALLSALTLCGVIACKPSDVTVTGDLWPFAVRVTNEGPVELRDVIVLTSPMDTIRVASLAPNASVSVDRVRAVHENPVVQATVSGRQLALIPVEGFVAFNPVLPVGAYQVSLSAVGAPAQLTVVVRRN